MKKVGFGFISLALISLGVSCLSLNQKAAVPVNGEFVPEGMVAYAASYSSNITNEPKYATQNSTTFQYLNLGTTLNTYRGDSVKVGIIDSGINYDHEDFMVNSVTKVKGDSKYYEYQNSGWVYYGASQHAYSYIDDTLGHGTNVAATVAAAVNDVGGLGLAPNVELYVYKVTNGKNYQFGAVQLALANAITLGIDVINMSFQSYEHAVTYGSTTMEASVGCSTILSHYNNGYSYTNFLKNCYDAGITLVGAAGNYNTDEPSYPGSNDYVINVGSLNSTGTGKAPFSNYGSTIDLVAPGYVYVADKGTNSSYTDTSGTSFSAPLVTAAIALYKQKNPSATPAQIESALYASCDEIDDSGSAYTNWAGHGSLNVARFLGLEDNAPTEVVINNPEVVNEELSLEVGDTFDLDWTVNGNGTFDSSVNFYALEDNGVLSVNSNGHITALSTGSDCVVIESSANPNVYASIYVTVTSSGGVAPTVSSVTVSPASLTLDLNGTKTSTLSAVVNGTNNPSQSVTWLSSNTSVATVSSVGLVTAKAVGSTTISATSVEDNSKSGTCTVTVTDSTVHVTGVTLNKASTTITKGSNETLVASVSPNNATNKSVTWTSSNTGVATVSNGVVSVPSNATTSATAIITVKTVDGSYTATCTVTVGEKTATGEYQLVNSISDLSAGSSYLIANGTSGTVKTMAVTSNTNNRPTTNLTVSNNKLTRGSTALSVTLGGESGAWTFMTENYGGTAGYLNATSTTNSNYLQVKSSLDNYAYFSISFSGNAAVITCTGKTSRNIIRCNTSGTPISCYSNGQNPVYLWKEVVNKTLDSISVKTAPTKTSYEAGDTFDPAGLIITKTFTDNTTQDVSYANESANFTFSPNTSTALTTSDTSVTIVYGGKSCSQTITVIAAKTLSSISISGQTTSFVEGDAFVFGGTVTAHFSDSSSSDVTSSASFSGYNMVTLGSQTVTVSYTYKSTTKEVIYSITVSKGTLSSISLSGQTTTYMRNNAFSFDGTCTATLANGYQKTVTPTSVSSPDMTTAGQKTVTVSYTYNGVNQTTSYTITVNSSRQVIESGENVLGTITYTTDVEVISNNTLSTASSGGFSQLDTQYHAWRLGAGSKTGTLTVNSTTSNITKIVVNAKYYTTDSGTTFTIGGTSNTLTNSYADYEKTYSTPTNSIAISSVTNGKRVLIASITVYAYLSEDISQSSDCVGLESFIDTYMHMDYVSNLGYCKDSEHHYYSSAKAAFNDLNTHQRSLFTSNSAYMTEWTRLSAWADANNESLNQNNILGANKNVLPLLVTSESGKTTITVLMFSLIGISSIGGYLIIRRKREE